MITTLVCLCLITILTASVGIDNMDNKPTLWPGRLRYPFTTPSTEHIPTDLNQTIYRHLTLPAQVDKETGMVTFGSPSLFKPQNLFLPGSFKLLSRNTLQPIQAQLIRTCNPALLLSPPGSNWEYLAAVRFWAGLGDEESDDYGVFIIGLNITNQNLFFPVSDGIILDDLKSDGRIVDSEDPRLFYTDAGTPAMTIVRMAREPYTALYQDLRDMIPALGQAIRGIDHLTKSQTGETDDKNRHWGLGLEMKQIRKEGMTYREKNWLPMWPEPLADGISTIPSWLYRVSPFLTLTPDEFLSTPWQMRYSDNIPIGDEKYDNCFDRAFVDNALFQNSVAKDIRGSAGLSRLTLCSRSDRNCQPTIWNTIRLGIFHVRNVRLYYHFVASFNMSEPYNPLSVGPLFGLGEAEDGAMLFISSFSPIPLTRSNGTTPPRVVERSGVLPDHLFLDDQVAIGFGREDSEAMTLISNVKEMLGGHVLCKDL